MGSMGQTRSPVDGLAHSASGARVPRKNVVEEPRISIVIPAYNEDDAIIGVLDRMFESVRLSCEVLVVVDREDDSAVPVVVEYSPDTCAGTGSRSARG